MKKKEPHDRLPDFQELMDSAKQSSLPESSSAASNRCLADGVLRQLRRRDLSSEDGDEAWIRVLIDLGRWFAIGACALAMLTAILVPDVHGKRMMERENSLANLGEW